jgi:GntR family transcriptional regulator
MGLIVRRHGVGNFVASGAIRLESGLEELISLDRLAARHGHATEVTEVTLRKVRASAIVAAQLGVSEGTKVCLAESVRALQGRPIAHYRHYYLPGTFNDEELTAKYGGSVLDLIVTSGTPRIRGAMTVVRAVSAVGRVKEKLSVKRGYPLLLLEQLLYDMEGKVLSFAELYYVTDGRLSFHILRRPPMSAG